MPLPPLHTIGLSCNNLRSTITFEEEFYDTIENFKINSLLFTNKEITDNFIIVVAKNIIYNRPKSKIKLEFHNMDSNNLNNDIIISVLNKLQNIINTKESIEVNDSDEIDNRSDSSLEVSEQISYEEYTIRELKEKLSSMGLPISGNKHKLIQRILFNENKNIK